MKYYKCKLDNKIAKKMMTLRINKYKSKEKRNYKINSFLEKFFICLFFILTIGYFVLISFLDDLIKNSVVSIILTILLVIFYLPICVFGAYIPYRLISKHFSYGTLPKVTNEMINEVSKPLKEHYNLTDNYLVTKCYYSSNPNIINKDVLIYIYENKIRITNDFYHSTKDFGCYELLFEEIKIYNKVEENRVYTIIETNDFIIHLGKTTKNFILNNYKI